MLKFYHFQKVVFISIKILTNGGNFFLEPTLIFIAYTIDAHNTTTKTKIRVMKARVCCTSAYALQCTSYCNLRSQESNVVVVESESRSRSHLVIVACEGLNWKQQYPIGTCLQKLKLLTHLSHNFFYEYFSQT